MKKLYFLFYTISSIPSISIYCQNDLDQKTKDILNNASQLKQKIKTIKPENYKNSIENIETALIAQFLCKNIFFFQQVSPEEKLESIIQWFEKEKTIEDWNNYFAIHNQCILFIKKELQKINKNSLVYKQIINKILSSLKNDIEIFSIKNKSILEIKSLMFIYQDYQELFKKYYFYK